jgi:Thiamine biosynthesis protein (ThiI)
MNPQRKAIALISGGLDSMLAAMTVMEQGVHVEGINFFNGFCVEGHTHAIREKDKSKAKHVRRVMIRLTDLQFIPRYRRTIRGICQYFGKILVNCPACPSLQIIFRCQGGDFFRYRCGNKLVDGNAFIFGKFLDVPMDGIG